MTISEFRKNLFKLVEQVIAGETVEFVHRGTTVRLVIPEGAAPSRFDRLTPRVVINSKLTEKQHRAAEKKLRAEIWDQIAKDWKQLEDQ